MRTKIKHEDQFKLNEYMLNFIIAERLQLLAKVKVNSRQDKILQNLCRDHKYAMKDVILVAKVCRLQSELIHQPYKDQSKGAINICDISERQDTKDLYHYLYHQTQGQREEYYKDQCKKYQSYS